MPVYIAKIYQDNQIQEVIVRADNVRAAKRAAQPKVVVCKLTPEQVFEYMKSGVVFPNADLKRDTRTMDMFPVEFSLFKPHIKEEEVGTAC